MEGPVTSAMPRGTRASRGSRPTSVIRHLPVTPHSVVGPILMPDFCPKPQGALAKSGFLQSNVAPEKTITRKDSSCFPACLLRR
ncbi:hypothetical protein GCM10023082_43510 [Streptomyces tremellae]|uniref:Uncharacterized protein n=1 Tax=Streptomyces tremellae TaxID=1124239 RepID=A0ABP7FKU2_9ACTN